MVHAECAEVSRVLVYCSLRRPHLALFIVPTNIRVHKLIAKLINIAPVRCFQNSNYYPPIRHLPGLAIVYGMICMAFPICPNCLHNIFTDW